jgi:hypothetical protein
MGSVVAGPGLSSGLTDQLSAITDTLFANEALVDEQGRPSRRFQQVWQNTIEALVSVLTSQGASISELEAIYAGINTAQATASAAAQQTQATAAAVSLANSYTDPVSGLLTASSAGAVTISAHRRIYGDGLSVDVNGGALSGLSPGDFVRVYYNDPARTGGTVSYLSTTGDIVQQGDVHVLGGVLIPAVGELPSSGAPSTPPGYVPDYRDFLV